MRPFNIRQLMQEQTGNPFLNNEKKMSYMWRDIERRAERYGIPIRLPVRYPIENFVLTNQMSMLAAQEGWCRPFALRVYHYWFAEGVLAGSEANIRQSLLDVGQNPNRVYDAATSDTVQSALEEATDQARSFGIFGSPNFLVGDEVFWGDDRAEDAIRFAKAL